MRRKKPDFPCLSQFHHHSPSRTHARLTPSARARRPSAQLHTDWSPGCMPVALPQLLSEFFQYVTERREVRLCVRVLATAPWHARLYTNDNLSCSLVAF